MKYAITNCNILDGTFDMEVKANMCVLVDGERIVRICRADEIPGDVKKIDAGGGYLLPGLINLHVHLFGTGRPSKALGGGSSQKKLVKFVGTPLGKKVVDALVASAAKTELMSGVTTLRAVGDFHFSDVRVRDKINAGKLTGARLIVSGPAITAVGGHGYGTFAEASNDPEELRALVRKNKENGVDFIKTCSTGGVMDAKHKGEAAELKMSSEQLCAVVDEAHKQGLMVASHTESPAGVDLDLLAGVNSVEHGAPVGENTIAAYKRNKVAYVLTLSPAVPLSTLPHEITKLGEVAESVAKVVMQNMIDGAKQALEYDLSFGIGTDASCPFCTQYNMWRELAYLVKYVGVTNKFALATATLGNAKVLKLDKEIGTVMEGKVADMFLVKENPLTDLRALSEPVLVFARGKIVKPKLKKNAYVEETLDKLL